MELHQLFHLRLETWAQGYATIPRQSIPPQDQKLKLPADFTDIHGVNKRRPFEYPVGFWPPDKDMPKITDIRRHKIQVARIVRYQRLVRVHDVHFQSRYEFKRSEDIFVNALPQPTGLVKDAVRYVGADDVWVIIGVYLMEQFLPEEVVGQLFELIGGRRE